MDNQAISNRLIQEMLTGNWSEPIYWPNNPPAEDLNGKVWLRWTPFFIKSSSVSLRGTYKQPVMVQVDIFLPFKDTTVEGLAICKKLQTIFSKNTKLELADGFIEPTGFSSRDYEYDGSYRIICEIDLIAYGPSL